MVLLPFKVVHKNWNRYKNLIKDNGIEALKITEPILYNSVLVVWWPGGVHMHQKGMYKNWIKDNDTETLSRGGDSTYFM